MRNYWELIFYPYFANCSRGELCSRNTFVYGCLSRSWVVVYVGQSYQLDYMWNSFVRPDFAFKPYHWEKKSVGNDRAHFLAESRNNGSGPGRESFSRISWIKRPPHLTPGLRRRIKQINCGRCSACPRELNFSLPPFQGVPPPSPTHGMHLDHPWAHNLCLSTRVCSLRLMDLWTMFITYNGGF